MPFEVPGAPNVGMINPSEMMGTAFGATQNLKRRKLLVPPFNGKRMRAYEHVIEDEVMRETLTWREGEEFATLEPMLRLTLGSILRAVFGAEGPVLEELRVLLPMPTVRRR